MKRILLLLCLLIRFSNVFLQQEELDSAFISKKYLGACAGYNLGSMVDFTRDEGFSSKYNFKSGSLISIYFQKASYRYKYKLEIQYGIQQADMEIKFLQYEGSYYKNLDYTFQHLNLNFSYLIALLNKKGRTLNLLIGPTLSAHTKTHSKGFGWNEERIYQIDSLGQSTSYINRVDYQTDDNKSIDLANLKLGVDVGLNLSFPLKQKLDFIIENRYRFYLTNFTIFKANRSTSFLTGGINLGLRYNF